MGDNNGNGNGYGNNNNGYGDNNNNWNNNNNGRVSDSESSSSDEPPEVPKIAAVLSVTDLNCPACSDFFPYQKNQAKSKQVLSLWIWATVQAALLGATILGIGFAVLCDQAKKVV